MATNNDIVGSLKPNSNKYKEQEAKKKVTAVTKGKAKLKDESIKDKFAKAFIQEDIKSVKDYVIFENIIPELKSIILNAIYDGLGMLFGITKKPNKNGGKTNYAAVSTAYSYKPSTVNNSGNDSSNRNTRTDYSSIVYATKEDATEVLSRLQELAKEYETASVSDLFELAGVSSNGFTDCYWGWTFDMIKFVPVRRVREGWILELPKPVSDD